MHGFSVSIDGYGAGPEQSHDNPIGVGGRALHSWIWTTRTFRERFGMEGGQDVGLDEMVVRDENHRYGAGIIGRNMFGPTRGAWEEEEWRGWWGENPPFHYPVFVLSHYPRQPVEMEGGTTFHFVTEGPEVALAMAREHAGERDVRLSGGAQTIRQYVALGLVDDIHLAVSPVLLGRGEPVFHDLDDAWSQYNCVHHAASADAIHLWFKRNNTEGPQ